jgi:putative sterol carrier protein
MPRPKRQKVDHKSSNNMAHAWSDLPAALSTALPKANEAAKTDGQLKAFVDTPAIDHSATFGIKSGGSDSAILVTVSEGKVEIRDGPAKEALFTLNAQPEQWQEFMKQTPVMPYQSYWGEFSVDYR